MARAKNEPSLGVQERLLQLAIALSMAASSYQFCSAAGITDPSQAQAIKLWTADKTAALLHVKAQEANDRRAGNGTAYFVSSRHALTAGHMVCDPATRKPYEKIELRLGNRDAAAFLRPEEVVCHPGSLDVAILFLGEEFKATSFLKVGAHEDLTGDPFVSLFGFGGNSSLGRLLKGNAALSGPNRLAKDDFGRIRTDMNGVEGDSGGPAIDVLGRAVGVVTSGSVAGTTAFVPLRDFGHALERINVRIPPPVDRTVVRGGQGKSENELRGQVTVHLGRARDGAWPPRPTRVANVGEVEVVLTLHRAEPEIFSVRSDEGGTWGVQLLKAVPASGLQFSAVATQVHDLQLAPEKYGYRSDVLRGTLRPNDLTKVISVQIYERSAFVMQRFGRAKAKEEILRAQPLWRKCSPLLEVPPGKAPTCSRNNPNMLATVQKDVDSIDDDFIQAFKASAAEPLDIEITTNIAATWSNFRMAAGRPCRAVESMQALFQKFANNQLSTTLVEQPLTMMVRCLQIAGSAPGGHMAWRTKDETRQSAAIRLMLDTLKTYAPSAKEASPIRRTVLAEMTTAFELYSAGAVTRSEAARRIASSADLSGYLKEFVSTFAIPWCGKRVTIPTADPVSVEQTLTQLRTQLKACTAI